MGWETVDNKITLIQMTEGAKVRAVLTGTKTVETQYGPSLVVTLKQAKVVGTKENDGDHDVCEMFAPTRMQRALERVAFGSLVLITEGPKDGRERDVAVATWNKKDTPPANPAGQEHTTPAAADAAADDYDFDDIPF